MLKADFKDELDPCDQYRAVAALAEGYNLPCFSLLPSWLRWIEQMTLTSAAPDNGKAVCQSEDVNDSP